MLVRGGKLGGAGEHVQHKRTNLLHLRKFGRGGGSAPLGKNQYFEPLRNSWERLNFALYSYVKNRKNAPQSSPMQFFLFDAMFVALHWLHLLLKIQFCDIQSLYSLL